MSLIKSAVVVFVHSTACGSWTLVRLYLVTEGFRADNHWVGSWGSNSEEGNITCHIVFNLGDKTGLQIIRERKMFDRKIEIM